MKAKIVQKKPIALLYRQEEIKNGEKLTALLEEMGIERRIVQPKELARTTGELAGYRPQEDRAESQQASIPQIPAMAMGGIAGKQLDQLLNAMNREGINLPVKMVITPHNENWAFGELIEEVSKEHELFLAMERLKRLSLRAQTLEGEEAKQLVQQAKSALSRMRGAEDKQPSREELEALSEQIENLF